jgi:heme oxygenase
MANGAHGESIMGRLREETREAHERAEKHPLQQELVKGLLPREMYLEHLGQLFLIHRVLDAGLIRLRDTRVGLAPIVADWQLQTPYLAEDLAFFGVDTTELVALPATASLMSRIASLTVAGDAALLGYHYVLEGSNNGSRFIAKAVRRSYGLEETQGTRYLDPYGDEQRARWQWFKDVFDALPLGAAERERVVGAARELFEAIGDISTELMDATGHRDAAAASPPLHATE